MADPRLDLDFDLQEEFEKDPMSFVKLPDVPLRLSTDDVATLEALLERDREGDDEAWDTLEGERLQDLLVYYTANYSPRTEDFVGLYSQLLEGLPMHKVAGGTTEKFLVALAYSCAYARRPVLYGLVIDELFKRTLKVSGKKTSFRRLLALQSVLDGIKDNVTPFGASQPDNLLQYAPTDGEVKYYLQDNKDTYFDTPPEVIDPTRKGDKLKRYGFVFFPLPVDAGAAAIITHDYGIPVTNAAQRKAMAVKPKQARKLADKANEYLNMKSNMLRLPEGTDTTVAYPYTSVAALRGLESTPTGVIQKPAVSAKELKAKVAVAKKTLPQDRPPSQSQDSQPAWVGLAFEELDSDESGEGPSLMEQFRQERMRREASGEPADQEAMRILEQALAAAAEGAIEEEEVSQAPIQTFSLAEADIPAVLEAIATFAKKEQVPRDDNLLVSVLIYAVARGSADLVDIFTACLVELESNPAVQDFVARLAYSAAYARRGVFFQVLLRYIFDTTQFDDDCVFVRQVAFDYLTAGIVDLVKSTQGTARETPYTPNPGEFPYSVNDGEVTRRDDGSPRLEAAIVDGFATQIVRSSYFIDYETNLVQEANLRVSPERTSEIAQGIAEALARVAGGAGSRPAVSGNLFRLAAITKEGQLGLVIDLPVGMSPEQLPIEGGLELEDVPQVASPIGTPPRRPTPIQSVRPPTVIEGDSMVQEAEEDVSSVDPATTLAHLITTGFEGPVAQLIFALVSSDDPAQKEVDVAALVELAVLAAYHRRQEIYGLILGQIELNHADSASSFSLYRVLVAGVDGVIDLVRGPVERARANANTGEVVDDALAGDAIDAHLAGILTRTPDFAAFKVEDRERMLAIPYLALDSRIRRLRNVFLDLDGTSEDPSASVAVLGRLRDEAVDVQIKTLRPVVNPVLGVLFEGTPARINYTVPLTLDQDRAERADMLLETRSVLPGQSPLYRTGGERRARVELDTAIRVLQRGGVGLSNDVAGNPTLDTFRDYVSRCSAKDLLPIAYSAAYARRSTFFWVVLGEMTRRNVSFSLEQALNFAINGFVDAVSLPDSPGTQALRDYQANPGELNTAATGNTSFDIGVVDMFIAATISPLAPVATYDSINTRVPTFVSENVLASLISRYSALYGAFTGNQPSSSLVIRTLDKMYANARQAQATVFAEDQLLPPPPAVFDVVPSQVQVGSPAPPTLESQVDEETGEITTGLRSMSLSSNESPRVNNSMPSDDSDVTVGLLDDSATQQMQEEPGIVLTRGVVAGGLEDLAASVIDQAANTTLASRSASSVPLLPIQDPDPNQSADLVSSVVSSVVGDVSSDMSFQPGQPREDSVNTILRRLGLSPESPDAKLPPPVSPIRGPLPRRLSVQSPLFVSPRHPVDGTRTPGGALTPSRPRPPASPVLVGRFTDAVPAPTRSPVVLTISSRSTTASLSPAPAPSGTAASMAVGTVNSAIRSRDNQRTISLSISPLVLSDPSSTSWDPQDSSRPESREMSWDTYRQWQSPVSPRSSQQSPLPDAQPLEWMDRDMPSPSPFSLDSPAPVPRLNLAAINANPEVRLDSDGVLTQVSASDGDESSSDTDFSAPASGRTHTFRSPLRVRGLRAGDIDDVLFELNVDSYDPETLVHVLESIASNVYSASEIKRGALFTDEATFRVVLNRLITLSSSLEEKYDLFSVKATCAANLRPRLLAVLADCKIRFDTDREISRGNGGDLGALCMYVVDSAMDVALDFTTDESPAGRATVHAKIFSIDTRSALCLRMLFHDIGRHSTRFGSVTSELLARIAKKIADSPLVFTYAYLSFVSHTVLDQPFSLLPTRSTDRLALTQHSLRLRGHAAAFIKEVKAGNIAALQGHWDDHLDSPNNPLFGSVSSSLNGYYLANSPKLIVTLLEAQDLDLSAAVAAITSESMTSDTLCMLMVDNGGGPSTALPSSSYVKPLEGQTEEESASSYATYLKLLKTLFLLNMGDLALTDFLAEANEAEIKYILTDNHAGQFNLPMEDIVDNFVITTKLDDGTMVYSNGVDTIEIDEYSDTVVLMLQAGTVGLDNYEAILSPWVNGLWSNPSMDPGEYLARIITTVSQTSGREVRLAWLKYLAATDVLLLYCGKPLRAYARAIAKLLKSKLVVNDVEVLLYPWARKYVFPEDREFVMWEDLSTVVKAATVTPNMTTFILWYAHFEAPNLLDQFGTGRISPNDALVEELVSPFKTRSVRLDVAFMLRQRMLDRLCRSKTMTDKSIAQRISIVRSCFPIPDPAYVFDPRFEVSTRVQANLEICVRFNRAQTLVTLLRDVKYTTSPSRTPYIMDSAWIDRAVSRAASYGNLRIVQALLASFGDRLSGVPFETALVIGAIGPSKRFIGTPSGLRVVPPAGETMPTPRTQDAIIRLVMKHICPPALAAAILDRDYEAIVMYAFVIKYFDMHDERVYAAFSQVQNAVFTSRIKSRERGSAQAAAVQGVDQRIVKAVLQLQQVQEQAVAKNDPEAGPSA